MRYRRQDVIARAIEVLDTYGLADLSMRRLGQELGVQPSALYHHFASKQTLLAAIADEVLRRGARPVPDGPWDERVVAVARSLRDAMLAYRDGAELVATAFSFGLGARQPYDDLLGAVRASGMPDELVNTAARTIWLFTLGHTTDEQTHVQAGSAGAISDQPRDVSDFDDALALILDGLRVRAA